MKTITKTETQEPTAEVQRGKTGARSQNPSRNQKDGRQPKWGLRNILVPVDFSEPSKKSLRYTLCFASLFDHP
jgi:hypothetical protein